MSSVCLDSLVAAGLCEVAVPQGSSSLGSGQKSVSNAAGFVSEPPNTQHLLSEETVQLSVRSDGE